MSIKLDYSDFKHVSSDEKSTTLEHKKDGHKIIINHNVIPKEHVSKLKSLGASAKDAKQSDDKGEEKADKQAQDAKYGKVVDAKSNKPQVYAEGGQVTDTGEEYGSDTIQQPTSFELGDFSNVQPVTPPIEESLKFNPNEEFHVTPEMEAKGREGKINFPEESGKVQYDKAVGEAQNRSPLRPEPTPAETQAAVSQTLAPEQSAQSLAPQSMAAASPQAASAQPQDEYTKNLMGGYNTQLAGIYGQAKAEGQLGEAQAKVHEQQQKDLNSALDVYKNQLSNIEKDMAAHTADIQNGYIDPNKYWTGYTLPNGQKVEGHSKVAAAIGMILGGFSPSGGPNEVAGMLNRQIDNSINAQMKNLDASQNLLRANMEHYKDISTATQVTRAMMADAVLAQLNQAAAKAKTPMAKAMAQQAAGPIMIQKANAIAQATAFQTLNQLSKGGTNPDGKQDPMNTGAAEQAALQMQRFNPELAKFYMQRIVPGIGVATQQVTDKTRDAMIAAKDFNNHLQHYVDWVQKNSGTLNPAKIAEGKAMAAEMSAAYRAARNGGVYKETEQHFIDQIIPEDPSQFLAGTRTLPKINEVMKMNQMSLENMRKGVGMAPSSLGQSAPQARFQEGSIATNPKTGEKVIFQNGKWVKHK